ncbi:ABC transporter permease [Azospirillum sp. RWY-5-1]|uniref:ABC transporter permease n=1 Tax=Azospirillum oleiclasticum TaxID=2735135 RepID=A0ABX2T4W1_9PROT|nr:ABC transporter permease [Azospirillum oleiclasticum]NYZ12094.1 ABC transporter permease [Azospirillum oleiclasticum]NYZ19254.1 ABC transporter permease [Azospirillum oleiclasticum]
MRAYGRSTLVLAYPALVLGMFLLVPFGIMAALSVFRRVPAGTFEPAMVPDNYLNLLTPFFLDRIGFTLGLSAAVAVVCVALGFPFTYLLTRLPRRRQVPWLVFLLAVLALSEVIVGFAWSVLLSRTAGLSNLLVWLGLLSQPESWAPGLTAMMLGLCYLAFPYTVLVLYPSLSRLDPSYLEAARTLGASPLRGFFGVIVPVSRPAILATLVMVFVFALGAYVLPQLLGRPQHWTLAVHITDQALSRSNVPAAAAMSITLLLASLALVLVTAALGNRRKEQP